MYMNLKRARLIAWGMPLCVLGMALYLGSYIYLRDADEKLYVGKQSGKNMLVSAKTSIKSSVSGVVG